MKRLIALCILAAAALLAAEGNSDPDAPNPLTAEEQLTAARAQIAVLQTELANAQAQNQALRSQMAAADARAKYESTAADMRKAHKADDKCELKTDQSWICPTAKPDK